LNATSTQFLVYVTNNSGNTWSKPTTVTEDAALTHFKPWMAYSPKGVLGLMWRTYTEPGASGDDGSVPYNVWASTSNNGGTTFSTPLEISSSPSPAPDPKQKVGGDDFSFISLNGQDALVAWADWRPGDMSGYFSAVNLKAFNYN
jgi:hypothetical protein